jgi:NAD(P)-dependent dehydrogenase (short-subunit alcohol dehydrogenase family)
MTTSTASTTTGELSGQTALVTGATSGIGKAAALKLAEHGATVLVHGRDASRGAQPEEIAETIAFLASPHAAYITGATIAVGGGRTAI